jgi:succinate dehydrogenase / fumarate reductase flavoprotein subunit
MLRRQPLEPMRADLMALFEREELKKYLTPGELPPELPGEYPGEGKVRQSPGEAAK